MGMFIPGIFICGDACGLGDAAGIGMLCMCGVGDGVGEAAGICIPGMFGIWGVGERDALGVGDGEGIGIPCLCCACVAETTSVNARIPNDRPECIGVPFRNMNSVVTLRRTRVK